MANLTIIRTGSCTTPTIAESLPGIRESLKRRAAAIRYYLRKIEPPIAPGMMYRYSVTAARWEAVRLLIDRGSSTLRALTKKIGLGTEPVGSRDPHAVPNVTAHGGFLPHDPGRIICDTWQEAAVGW